MKNEQNEGKDNASQSCSAVWGTMTLQPEQRTPSGNFSSHLHTLTGLFSTEKGGKGGRGLSFRFQKVNQVHFQIDLRVKAAS